MKKSNFIDKIIKVGKFAARVIDADNKRAFKVIEFAIYCGKNGEGNYMAFKETITED